MFLSSYIECPAQVLKLLLNGSTVDHPNLSLLILFSNLFLLSSIHMCWIDASPMTSIISTPNISNA